MGIVHSCREHAAQIAIGASGVCEGAFPFSPAEDCAEDIPQILVITSPHGQQTCSGEYTLVEDWTPNGEPLWRKAGSNASHDKWLYSSIGGTWNVGGRRAEEQKFNCHFAHIISERPHNGIKPHNVNNWQWTDGVAFYTDPAITVLGKLMYEKIPEMGDAAGDSSSGRPWNTWTKSLKVAMWAAPPPLSRGRTGGIGAGFSECLQSGTDWVPGVFHPSAASFSRPETFEAPAASPARGAGERPSSSPTGVAPRTFAPCGKPRRTAHPVEAYDALDAHCIVERKLLVTPRSKASTEEIPVSHVNPETLNIRLEEVQAQREHAARQAVLQKERAERRAERRSRQSADPRASHSPFALDSGAESDENPEICATNIDTVGVSLEVTFWKSMRDRDREFKFTFTARPLGMEFERGKTPVVVKACARKSVAHGLGVKKGMVFASIEGIDVTRMRYDEFYALLTEKSMSLELMPGG
mmetsp:Transcript_68299/g.192578  ORF Transcript_68299/g.192578 Transcript_68299/m.192578 type:complete len:469 (-) Transcript_68299:241-1647(-)